MSLDHSSLHHPAANDVVLIPVRLQTDFRIQTLGLTRPQEKYLEAISLLERAILICEKKLGEHHPRTVAAQNCLELIGQKVCTQLSRLVAERHAQPIAREGMARLKTLRSV